jgi:hypothetical protein
MHDRYTPYFHLPLCLKTPVNSQAIKNEKAENQDIDFQHSVDEKADRSLSTVISY